MISASTKIELRDDPAGAVLATKTIGEAFPNNWDRAIAIAVLRREGAAWFDGGEVPAVFVTIKATDSTADADLVRRLVTLGVSEAQAVKARAV